MQSLRLNFNRQQKKMRLPSLEHLKFFKKSQEIVSQTEELVDQFRAWNEDPAHDWATEAPTNTVVADETWKGYSLQGELIEPTSNNSAKEILEIDMGGGSKEPVKIESRINWDTRDIKWTEGGTLYAIQHDLSTNEVSAYRSPAR